MRRTQEIVAAVILRSVLLLIVAADASYFCDTYIIGMGEDWWQMAAFAAIVIVASAGFRRRT